jgi:hypothetical protein
MFKIKGYICCDYEGCEEKKEILLSLSVFTVHNHETGETRAENVYLVEDKFPSAEWQEFGYPDQYGNDTRRHRCLKHQI